MRRFSKFVIAAMRSPLRDYARIDFRLGNDSGLRFLEANANPSLTRGTFGVPARRAGLGYTELLTDILDLTMKRQRKMEPAFAPADIQIVE